jgi:hypothetical protein
LSFDVLKTVLLVSLFCNLPLDDGSTFFRNESTLVFFPKVARHQFLNSYACTMSIYYNGKLLNPSKNLYDYNIQMNTSLNLSGKLTGGMQNTVTNHQYIHCMIIQQFFVCLKHHLRDIDQKPFVVSIIFRTKKCFGSFGVNPPVYILLGFANSFQLFQSNQTYKFCSNVWHRISPDSFPFFLTFIVCCFFNFCFNFPLFPYIHLKLFEFFSSRHICHIQRNVDCICPKILFSIEKQIICWKKLCVNIYLFYFRKANYMFSLLKTKRI